MAWHVLVPVKELEQAKSRLDLPTGLRRQLTVAMAMDVVQAALDVPDVQVHVVSPRPPAFLPDAAGLGWLPDEGGGLSAAVAAAAAGLAGPVAVVAADLPALTADVLGRALSAAEAHAADRSLVADANDTGTTMLTSRHGDRLGPAYGEDSRRRHVASGAVDLTAVVGAPGIRRDVDTVGDLVDAARLGLGPATRRVLAASGWPAVHR